MIVELFKLLLSNYKNSPLLSQSQSFSMGARAFI